MSTAVGSRYSEHRAPRSASVCALSRKSMWKPREPDHLPERPYCTNPLLSVNNGMLNGGPPQENSNGEQCVIYTLFFYSYCWKSRRIRHNAYLFSVNSATVNMYYFISMQVYVKKKSIFFLSVHLSTLLNMQI